MMMMMILFQVKHETQKHYYGTGPRSRLGPKKIDDFQHTRSSSVYLLGRFCSRCAASWLAPTVGIFYLTASFFFACPSMSWVHGLGPLLGLLSLAYFLHWGILAPS